MSHRSFMARVAMTAGYSHEAAEDIVQKALDEHAHELAETQREACRKTDDPVYYLGEAGWLADLIDPQAGA